MSWLHHRTVISTPILSVSMLLIALASVLGQVGANSSKNAAEARAALFDDVRTCRDRLTAGVTDASTTYANATGQVDGAAAHLLVLLAVGGDVSSTLDAITVGLGAQAKASAVLNAATDARVVFEQHPTGHCSPPPAVTVRPTTPTLPPIQKATTSTTIRPRRTSSTTTTLRPIPPSTTTTSIAHTSPTTVPPGRLCSLVVVGMCLLG